MGKAENRELQLSTMMTPAEGRYEPSSLLPPFTAVAREVELMGVFQQHPGEAETSWKRHFAITPSFLHTHRLRSNSARISIAFWRQRSRRMYQLSELTR